MASRLNLLTNTLPICSTSQSLLDSVNKFATTQLPKYLSTSEKANQPRELYQQFGKLGLLGPTLPEPYGIGTSYLVYGLIGKELETIDSGFRSMYSVQSSLVMNPIYKYGTDAIRDNYLPGLGSGDLVGCFGLTEPDSGSDATTMKTNARQCGNDYVLNGNKTWITNASISDVLLVWAKVDDTIGGFVIDRQTPGVSTPEITDKMSLLNSPTGMIYLEDVVVPRDNRLKIDGMKGPFSCLNDARLGISLGVMGAAQNCLETTMEYASSRYLFGESLASKQIFQSKLAGMVTDYNLGLLAAIEISKMVDNNMAIPPMISLIKRNNCQKALEIARTCRDILGGNGISHHYNVFRHLINLETVNTYEGTFDIHSLILGNYVTGEKAF
jgi:glutaryl-CoA dehydrogenase